ncbi:MAG: TerC family protein [Rhodothermia bacterium]|nr:MAG: TerC family protein [Rhodothermia bacterium]
MFDWFSDPQAWIALGTLTALEIVLGIDNIIFISILANRLPSNQQNKARLWGLTLALFGRIALLLSLTVIMRLTEPIFTVLTAAISGRDIILMLGGLFLLAKGTREIHDKLEGGVRKGPAGKALSLASVLVQILVLDLIFSLDSVITAVGMVDIVPVMVAAIVIAVLFMMVSARAISEFIEDNPTIKMLALAFLLMVGVALIAESMDVHIPRGYIYFAMAFSVFVELLNLKLRDKSVEPAELRGVPTEDDY